MDLIDKTEAGRVARLGLYIFPVFTFIFLLFYLIDESLYRSLISEDGIVEWLTFAFLIAAGIISLLVAIGIRRKHGYLHWFFLLFFGFNLLAGMEEISWGQRVFGMETTGIFEKYSDQNEINLHNTFQGIFKIKTKHIALLVLLIYGGILPGFFRKKGYWPDNILGRQFIVPPLFLRPGFIIAVVLMLDFQTGHEEEIGEFFFSICFFLMMVWNRTLLKSGYFMPPVGGVKE